MGLHLHREQRRPQSALRRRPAEEQRQAICRPGAHLDERVGRLLGPRASRPHLPIPPQAGWVEEMRAGRPRSQVGYAAAATLPLKVRPNFVAETATLSPSLTRPERIISASGSCRYFWITRLSGRAP